MKLDLSREMVYYTYLENPKALEDQDSRFYDEMQEIKESATCLEHGRWYGLRTPPPHYTTEVA
jgi:hypothetical protein